MLIVTVLGILLAIGVYLLIRMSIMNWVENSYNTQEARQDRYDGYMEDLQEYVYENQLSSEDTAKISKWLRGTRNVYLFLYKDNQLFYAGGIEEDDKNGDEEGEAGDGEGDTAGGGEDTEGSDSSGEQNNTTRPGTSIGGITIDYPTKEEILQHAADNGLEPIELKDGTLLASFVDYSEYFYYEVANIASIVGAFVVLIIVLMLYFHAMTARISRLAEDVSAVYEVDVKHEIRAGDGKDELSELSRNVKQMKNSMLQSIEAERAAQNANIELITSMSHDIRTPLTVLLGYIDIMEEHADDDVMRGYLKASESTAMKLKNLSDDMFRYFLVFGNGNISLDMNEYNVKILFAQLFSEHILLLREQGFAVEWSRDISELPELEITTDAPKLMRVVDNLFSNIYKYADVGENILFFWEISDGVLKFSITNRVKENNNEAESNGVGLRTCAKLCEVLGITFKTHFDTVESKQYFTSELGFTVKNIE